MPANIAVNLMTDTPTPVSDELTKNYWFKRHSKEVARWRDEGMNPHDALDVMRDMMRTITHLAKLAALTATDGEA